MTSQKRVKMPPEKLAAALMQEGQRLQDRCTEILRNKQHGLRVAGGQHVMPNAQQLAEMQTEYAKSHGRLTEIQKALNKLGKNAQRREKKSKRNMDRMRDMMPAMLESMPQLKGSPLIEHVNAFLKAPDEPGRREAFKSAVAKVGGAAALAKFGPMGAMLAPVVADMLLDDSDDDDDDGDGFEDLLSGTPTA